MLTGGSGDEAGPLTTAPLVILNLLPWHGQLIVPPDTLPTVHPAWVHTALNAWNAPDCGWVITIFLSVRILPPPTGMSEVLASAAGAAAAPEPGPADAAGAADEEAGGAGWLPAIPPLLELYLLHPASTAAHAAPAQASTVRRRDARTLDAGSLDAGSLEAGSLDAASLGSAMRETPQRLMPKVEKNQ